MNYFIRKSGTIHMDVPKYSGGSLKFIMPYHCVPVPSISIICIHWFKYLTIYTTTYDQVYSLFLV